MTDRDNLVLEARKVFVTWANKQEPDEGIRLVAHAPHIGDLLEKNHPRIEAEGSTLIAKKDVVEIADVITLVVAQILQSWLNAGSERDNTMEELGPPIEDHVRSWAV